eukprot:a523873_20.p5 GENE.a523873_20~~a523873_20.p5  ORF type:complete len:113 (-),score=11.18 a523873_20:455-766(-)
MADGQDEPKARVPPHESVEELQKKYWEKFGPKPHRCQPYLEDFFQIAAEQFPPKIGRPLWAFLQCLRAEPGKEPPRVPRLSLPPDTVAPPQGPNQGPTTASNK